MTGFYRDDSIVYTVLHQVRANIHEDTSIHGAAVCGHKRILKKLLKQGYPVDIPNDVGQTSLFCASFEGHESMVEYLLKHGANPNARCDEESTPVHAAAYSGNIKILSKLIEAGGDLRLHDKRGRTIIDWAQCQGDVKRKGKMIEFIEKTRHFALTHSCKDLTVKRPSNRQPTSSNRSTLSLGSIFRPKSMHKSTSLNSTSVHSLGFGKIYLGNRNSVGTVATIPLVAETSLKHDEFGCTYNNGPFMVMESMFWGKTLISAKRLHKKPPEGGQVDDLITENEYMAKLRHPNLLLLMAVCQTNNLEGLVLLYERIGCGSLYHYLHERYLWILPGVPLSNVLATFLTQAKLSGIREFFLVVRECITLLDMCDLMRQICDALIYLHSQNLLHCYITSHAIQLVMPNLAKLGNLEYMVENNLSTRTMVHTNTYMNAAFNWMAPELMDGSEPPTEASDLYSICAVIWEILNGFPPWYGVAAYDIKKDLEDNGAGLQINNISETFKYVLQTGLSVEMSDRHLTAHQLREYLIKILVEHIFDKPWLICHNCSGGMELSQDNDAPHLQALSPRFSRSTPLRRKSRSKPMSTSSPTENMNTVRRAGNSYSGRKKGGPKKCIEEPCKEVAHAASKENSVTHVIFSASDEKCHVDGVENKLSLPPQAVDNHSGLNHAEEVLSARTSTSKNSSKSSGSGFSPKEDTKGSAGLLSVAKATLMSGLSKIGLSKSPSPATSPQSSKTETSSKAGNLINDDIPSNDKFSSLEKDTLDISKSTSVLEGYTSPVSSTSSSEKQNSQKTSLSEKDISSGQEECNTCHSRSNDDNGTCNSDERDNCIDENSYTENPFKNDSLLTDKDDEEIKEFANKAPKTTLAAGSMDHLLDKKSPVYQKLNSRTVYGTLSQPMNRHISNTVLQSQTQKVLATAVSDRHEEIVMSSVSEQYAAPVPPTRNISSQKWRPVSYSTNNLEHEGRQSGTPIGCPVPFQSPSYKTVLFKVVDNEEQSTNDQTRFSSRWSTPPSAVYRFPLEGSSFHGKLSPDDHERPTCFKPASHRQQFEGNSGNTGAGSVSALAAMQDQFFRTGYNTLPSKHVQQPKEIEIQNLPGVAAEHPERKRSQDSDSCREEKCKKLDSGIGLYVPRKISPREKKSEWFGGNKNVKNIIRSFQDHADQHEKKQAILCLKSKTRLATSCEESPSNRKFCVSKEILDKARSMQQMQTERQVSTLNQRINRKNVSMNVENECRPKQIASAAVFVQEVVHGTMDHADIDSNVPCGPDDGDPLTFHARTGGNLISNTSQTKINVHNTVEPTQSRGQQEQIVTSNHGPAFATHFCTRCNGSSSDCQCLSKTWEQDVSVVKKSLQEMLERHQMSQRNSYSDALSNKLASHGIGNSEDPTDSCDSNSVSKTNDGAGFIECRSAATVTDSFHSPKVGSQTAMENWSSGVECGNYGTRSASYTSLALSQSSNDMRSVSSRSDTRVSTLCKESGSTLFRNVPVVVASFSNHSGTSSVTSTPQRSSGQCSGNDQIELSSKTNSDVYKGERLMQDMKNNSRFQMSDDSQEILSAGSSNQEIKTVSQPASSSSAISSADVIHGVIHPLYVKDNGMDTSCSRSNSSTTASSVTEDPVVCHTVNRVHSVASFPSEGLGTASSDQNSLLPDSAGSRAGIYMGMAGTTGNNSGRKFEVEEFYFDDVLHPDLTRERHMRLQTTLPLDQLSLQVGTKRTPQGYQIEPNVDQTHFSGPDISSIKELDQSECDSSSIWKSIQCHHSVDLGTPLKQHLDQQPHPTCRMPADHHSLACCPLSSTVDENFKTPTGGQVYEYDNHDCDGNSHKMNISKDTSIEKQESVDGKCMDLHENDPVGWIAHAITSQILNEEEGILV